MQKLKALFSIYIISVSLSNVLCQTIFSDNGKFGIMDDENKKITVSAEYDKITEAFKNESFGAEKNTHSFILDTISKKLFQIHYIIRIPLHNRFFCVTSKSKIDE